jgi:glycosyltransferase involved in cell wall biosynthesis
MRVALVVDDFALNFGQGRYTVELARRLRHQFEVHLFCNSFQAPHEPGFVFHHVPCWRASAITTSISFAACAERALRRERLDIVHAQGMSCWGADVITAHMCNAAKYQRLPPAGWRGRLFPWLIVPLERRFFRQRRARRLIAISHRFGRDIIAHYGWDKPLSVIYHGTDTDYFCPPENAATCQALRVQFGLPAGAWRWLFMGEAVKGLRDAIAQLVNFPQAVLLAVSRSDFAPYGAFAARLGVGSRVRFWGVESSPVRAFQAADVFVYASRYDPFGLVVSEAMACGLPVVVGQDIGAAEWILPGENGLLCDPGAPESLRAQLKWLAADPARARQLGQAARQTVKAHSWDLCAAQTLAVYESLLKERAGKQNS